MEPRIFIIETSEQQARFASFIAKQKGLPLEVGVKDYIPQRTLPQNARLWKLHTLASEITGYSPEEMHDEALCHHYGFSEREVESLVTGKTSLKRVPLKRSSQRNKKEVSAFLEATENWYADEIGIWLNPDVNQR